MIDRRVERLADLVVEYALELREGQVLRIDGHDVGAPLAVALYRSALRVGALPYTNLTLGGLAEMLVADGSDEQISYISPIQWHEVEAVDAVVTIWSETNTRSFSRADERRHSALIAAQRRLSNRRWERISQGEMRWCGTLHPSPAHAQDADMSLDEYEAFFFGACHADHENPAAHWRESARALAARAAELEPVEELRILGPDTDLRVGVAGRTWMAADGRFNLPDGEVFTSPVETETRGEIRYTFPAIFHGREVEDIRLRFDGGRVVQAEASRGDGYLRRLLDLDADLRAVGERLRDVVVDIKTGVSGAGREATRETHFVSVADNVNAYKTEGHRHTAELEQELPDGIDITFMPHLIPIDQGLLATCYARVDEPLTRDELCDLFRSFYDGEPFIDVIDGAPRTADVRGTNRARVYATAAGERVVSFAAIDNLWKGAAGQAVQDLNLMLGLPETEGLE